MFTEKAQKIIDQAKDHAFTQGQSELTFEALIAALIAAAEARLLLANCLGAASEDLLESGPAFDGSESCTEKLPLAPGVQDLIRRAKKMAGEIPDRRHPGLIGIRHLVCAASVDEQLTPLMGASPVPEEQARTTLSGWSQETTGLRELDRLSASISEMRKALLSKVFGQDHAVNNFVEGIFNAAVVGQNEPDRKTPQAIFVFAGPPGVGKTFLAEQGARLLERPLKRFDMSSYSDHQSHSALVGWPKSYQAAHAGLLTEFVDKNPDAILLFDEIEKAHLNAVHLFLQILDAGRLEDKYHERDVIFKDTIIIFTTNAGRSLYNRENQTGVNKANATFHRRTVLDALRTEKDPATGQPFFPQAICSRIAKGYPILFNHLGVNELQRVSRAEINRFRTLFEQQYLKTITYDDVIPLAMVLREGKGADARTIKAQTDLFVKSEFFKLTQLFEAGRLEDALEAVNTVHFTVDLPDRAKSDIKAIFYNQRQPEILLVAAKPLQKLYTENVPGFTWHTAENTEKALQILASHDVDLVLLDLWVGSASGGQSATVFQFDHIPIGASALREGQRLLRQIHERMPGMPIYLLSAGEDQEKMDEQLFLACVQAGGARGVIESSFSTAGVKGWEEKRDRLNATLDSTCLHLYREKKAENMAQERKVLAFETSPQIDRSAQKVAIRLQDLRLTRAVGGEDADEIIEDVERPAEKFEDVYGAQEAKKALQFIVDWLQDPKRYAALGVRPPRGILLTGPPGTGKTMLARALAGESEAAFLVSAATNFVTIWQGSGPQAVRDLFNRGRRYAPSIIFIDEIDAIGRKRGGMSGRAEETTLNALLTEMDGFTSSAARPVILLAATNLAEHLDDALRRRFDREILVDKPDRQARQAFLQDVLEAERQAGRVSDSLVARLATQSADMTIADLKRIVNEAAVMAAQSGAPLDDALLVESFEKIRMGEAKDLPDEETLLRIARHESGHTLIGWELGIPAFQVTIVGRGSAGGYLERQADETKTIYTKQELENMICQAMGGRAAEMIFYGENSGLSTGVSGDLQSATRWAQRMVAHYGMEATIGQIFIHPDELKGSPVAGKVHEAVQAIVKRQLDRAVTLLENDREKLETLIEALVEKNRLSKEDLEAILD
jgi:ATP-dependent metalloprotease FtsH